MQVDAEVSRDSAKADVVIKEEVPRKWQSYLWDSLDKSAEERHFLFKLDAALLTFACLGYFIKYLDQANINNAFVSGMKEQLSLYHNELNYMQTCWTIGYVVGQIPSNIILTRLRPSIWIPSMEVIWTVLTFSISHCSRARQVYILRFFVGLAEGSFYPGMQYVIGSWYRKDELAKRSCIFHTSGAIATMCSGYLMASVYHLRGRGGYAGWQWLFLVDGIISLPIAVAGFFFIPDVPESSRAFYLTKDDRAFAVKRMILEGRKPRAPYTRAKVRKILTSWHIYLLTALYVLFNNAAAAAAPVFAQYLKASRYPNYSISQINNYPTTTYAFQIATTLIYAWSSDTFLKGDRLPPIIFGAIINIICYVSLAVWQIPDGWRWACYILSGAGYGLSGLCMAWAHEICSDDNEERAIVIASMNEMAYVLQAWLPLIVWQQVDAPAYRKGFITVSCLSVGLIIDGCVTKVLHERQKASAENERQYSDHEAGSSETEEQDHERSEIHATPKLIIQMAARPALLPDLYSPLRDPWRAQTLMQRKPPGLPALPAVSEAFVDVDEWYKSKAVIIMSSKESRSKIDHESWRPGIEVIVIERSSAPGGVWLYDDRLPLEPSYPATKPSHGDVKENFTSVDHDFDTDRKIRHAPPGPAYEGLMNNVSTRLMKLKLNDWPPGTPDFVNHRVLAKYIQDTSVKTGVHQRTVYDTRVEKIEKIGMAWQVTTSTLPARNESLKIGERSWMFDAIVIASGHYHACRIPDIPGLAAWKATWPDRVQHSKTYRRPGSFAGQNVLLIGAGVSSTDIARELGSVADTVYQTSRGGAFDLPPTLLPPNGVRISDIEAFEDPVPSAEIDSLDGLSPISFKVHLKDGRTLSSIHRVTICTGYHISLPFLRQFHDDDMPVSDASDTILVTDGTQIHNLHRDIFYIPDPSLAFIGVPYYTATFSLFEFQAIALAAAWSGRAKLPGEGEMRTEYVERLGKKGSGKGFHSLRGEEVAYVNMLVGWINEDREEADRVEGHTKEWFVANEDRLKMLRERLGVDAV